MLSSYILGQGNIHWIIENAREFQKNIYFCFIDYAKAFDCVDHKKLWKILKEMGIPDHLTCLLRNLYAGQEASVRTGHGTTVQFSHSIVSNSLRPHGLQHARPPCPSHQLLEFTCPVLTVASWSAYRFLKRQIRWSGIPISFRTFHSLLWSTQSKALA